MRPGSVVGTVMEVAVNGAFLFRLLIGAVRVSNGAMTIRALVAFLPHATYLTVPLAGLLRATALIHRGRWSLKRIQETLRLPVESRPDPVEDPAREPGLLLELRGCLPLVWGRKVPGEVSPQIAERGHLATADRSDTGKTTVTALVKRCYDLDGGEVLFRSAGLTKSAYRAIQSERSAHV